MGYGSLLIMATVTDLLLLTRATHHIMVIDARIITNGRHDSHHRVLSILSAVTGRCGSFSDFPRAMLMVKSIAPGLPLEDLID